MLCLHNGSDGSVRTCVQSRGLCVSVLCLFIVYFLDWVYRFIALTCLMMYGIIMRSQQSLEPALVAYLYL